MKYASKKQFKNLLNTTLLYNKHIKKYQSRSYRAINRAIKYNNEYIIKFNQHKFVFHITPLIIFNSNIVYQFTTNNNIAITTHKYNINIYKYHIEKFILKIKLNYHKFIYYTKKNNIVYKLQYINNILIYYHYENYNLIQIINYKFNKNIFNLKYINNKIYYFKYKIFTFNIIYNYKIIIFGRFNLVK